MLALCLGAGSFLAYGEVGSQEMEEAQGRVSVLEEEMARTEQTLKELEALKEDTAAYVRSLDANLNELNGQLTALSEDILGKEEEIRQAGLELEAARERESSQYESMKLRIKYMYEAGDTAFLDFAVRERGAAFKSDGICESDYKVRPGYAGAVPPGERPGGGSGTGSGSRTQ